MIKNSTDQKKTILFFSHKGGETNITGAENYLFTLINELQNHYHCIFVTPIQCLLTAKVQKLGIEVVVTPYPMVWSMWKPNRALGKEVQRLLDDPTVHVLETLIKEKKADIVVTNTCVNLLPAIAGKKIGLSVIWIICEVINDNAFTSQTIQLINRYSNWIVGVSQAVLIPFIKENLIQKTFLLYPTIHIGNETIDTMNANRNTVRKRLNLNHSDQLVGCIASFISPLKGFDHFIKMALSICGKLNDVHFVIVGKPIENDTYYRKCLKLIENSGFRKRFHILSFEKEIFSLYPAIDVMVIPSLVDEGFSLVCLESLIFGKPVVAYRSGGIIEQMNETNNETFLVTQGNIQELGIKVADLLTNPLRLTQIGKSNHIASMNNYGIKHFRERLARLFQHMLG